MNVRFDEIDCSAHRDLCEREREKERGGGREKERERGEGEEEGEKAFLLCSEDGLEKIDRKLLT